MKPAMAHVAMGWLATLKSAGGAYLMLASALSMLAGMDKAGWLPCNLRDMPHCRRRPQIRVGPGGVPANKSAVAAIVGGRPEASGAKLAGFSGGTRHSGRGGQMPYWRPGVLVPGYVPSHL